MWGERFIVDTVDAYIQETLQHFSHKWTLKLVYTRVCVYMGNLETVWDNNRNARGKRKKERERESE